MSYIRTNVMRDDDTIHKFTLQWSNRTDTDNSSYTHATIKQNEKDSCKNCVFMKIHHTKQQYNSQNINHIYIVLLLSCFASFDSPMKSGNLLQTCPI